MKKIKMASKAFVALTVLIGGGSAVAESSDSTPQSFLKSGAYIGISLGYSYMNSQVQEAMTVPAIFSAAPTASVISDGVTGDIFAGYRHFYESGYGLGGEMTFAVNNNTISKAIGFPFNVNTITPLTNPFQFIPAVVLSKKFTSRWLGFFKVGVNINQFSFTHYMNNRGPAEAGRDCGTYSKTTVGPMVAVGGEYVLDENVSAVGTVSYLGARKIKQFYPHTAFGPNTPNNLTASTIFNPYSISLKASFLYRF